jgi:hypothetical protein
MLKPAALLAFLCTLAACTPDPGEEPQTTGGQSTPSVMSPNPTAEDIPPADSNTTLPAATLEEAAPPPEP